MARATLAAGCFWGVEATFRQLEGVTGTCVGYTGGSLADPTYRDVCDGTTGHAEAVQVDYDPSVVSYEELLEVFWNAHDPTQLDRQGHDVGEQYRSAIFCHDPAQQAAALKSKQALAASGRFRKPIVTGIAAATTFWMAEDYHQQYVEKRRLAAGKRATSAAD